MFAKSIRDLRVAFLFVALGTLMVADSKADTFGFTRIEPSNASVDVAAQLVVNVTDAGSNQVLFTFEHDAGSGVTPNDATIAEIYFDDDYSILSSLAAIHDYQFDPVLYEHVDFIEGASPPNLPNSNNVTPPFEKPPDLAYGAVSDAPDWGVDPGESLGLLFDIAAGKSFDDVTSSMTAGSLRIGMHVISIAPDGQSDAFVSTVPVPVPGAFLLGSLGLGFAGWLRRKQNA